MRTVARQQGNTEREAANFHGLIAAAVGMLRAKINFWSR